MAEITPLADCLLNSRFQAEWGSDQSSRRASQFISNKNCIFTGRNQFDFHKGKKELCSWWIKHKEQ